MEQMSEFLSTAQNYYLIFAIVGSVFFVYMLIGMLFGVGFDDGGDFAIDQGADGLAGLQFLSVKSLITFITFFGWAGYFWGYTGILGLIIAIGSGLLMMSLTALVLFFLLKMQQSGNLTPEDFIGCSGTVYLTIPAGQLGGGQATISLKGCTRTVPAVAQEELKHGQAVRVVEVIGNNLYVVEKI